MNRKNPLSSSKLLYCIIPHFHWQLILDSLIRKRHFLFSFKNNLFKLKVLYLTSFWILGMQPCNIGHGKGQWNNFFRKIYIKMEFSSQERVMLLSLTTKWCQFWNEREESWQTLKWKRRVPLYRQSLFCCCLFVPLSCFIVDISLRTTLLNENFNAKNNGFPSSLHSWRLLLERGRVSEANSISPLVRALS